LRSQSYNGEINKLNPLNSSTGQRFFKTPTRKVSAMLSHNGMINELDPLNSSTEQRPAQNSLEKVFAKVWWF